MTISDATRSGPGFGTAAAYRLGHVALLALGRHSRLPMVGYKPARDLLCE